MAREPHNAQPGIQQSFPLQPEQSAAPRAEPLHDGPTPLLAGASHPSPPESGSGPLPFQETASLRILLVEKNEDDAHFVKEMLSKARALPPHHVTHVTSLGEAVEHLSHAPHDTHGTGASQSRDAIVHRPSSIIHHEFDLILVDPALPEASGLEAIARLRESAPNLPLVVLCAIEDEALAYEAVRGLPNGERGAQDYIVKEHNSPSMTEHVIRLTMERMREEKERSYLASIVQSSNDAIIGKSLDGIIVSWNKGAEHIYGYTAAEVIGLPISIIMPPDYRDDFHAILERIRRGERIEHFETVRVTKEGKRIDISLTVSPIKDKAGRITGASTLARDITERKRLEEAVLRQTREVHAQSVLLSAIISESPIGMVLYDRDMRIVQLNAEYARMARLDPKTARGQLLYDLAPASRTRSPLHQRALAGESIDELDVPFKFPDEDRSRHSEIRYRPIYDAEGTVTGILSTVIDVTERVHAEKEMEAQRTLLEAFIEAAPVGLVYFDRDMRIISMNAAFAAAGHLDLKADIGKVLYDLQPWSGASERKDIHRRAFAGELLEGQHYIVDDPIDKRRHSYDVYYRPVRDDEGQVVGMVSAVVDVTDRDELERRKSEFLSLASHELRTPVTVIKGYAQLALARAMSSGDEKQIRALRGINEHVAHLTRLITDLLDVSRIESGTLPLHPEEFDLRELIRDVVSSTELTTPGLACKLNLPADSVWIAADRHLIRSVLTNLLENAVKYSAGKPSIDIGIVPDGDEVTVSVRDRGLGIPPQDVPQLFNPFFRASNARSHPHNGLGLGLYISRGIVERHNGRIWVESGEQGGSTFYFSLPL